MSKKLLRFDEVQTMLGCSRRHIYDLLAAGMLKAQNPSGAPGPRGTKIIATSVDEYLRKTEIPPEKWSE